MMMVMDEVQSNVVSGVGGPSLTLVWGCDRKFVSKALFDHIIWDGMDTVMKSFPQIFRVDHQTGGTLQRNQQTTLLVGQSCQERVSKLSARRRINRTHNQMHSSRLTNYPRGIS